MSGRRVARLNEHLKREISEILRAEVRDPRVGSPTVTDVRVSSDLWVARVFVRADPSRPSGSEQELLAGLTAAAPFVRRSLSRDFEARRVPELRFELDRTIESAARIERTLREVLPDSGQEEAEGVDTTDAGDSDPAESGSPA